MRCEFIESHRKLWPVRILCRLLEVSPSGYYAWRNRPPSASARRREELTNRIRDLHQQKHHHSYGSPRIHQELVAQGCPCNRKTVAKLMKQAGIQASTEGKRSVSTTNSNHALPVAENIVNRDFAPTGKNITWVADITYIPTAQGWLYLAAVEDLYTRKIVGWSMSERIDSRLVTDALEMALQRELPGAGLMAHSDRGVQYASNHYQQVLERHGITCSMSRKGNCWDNAPMESFFATLKKEHVHQCQYQSHDEARLSIFDYIETFYNPVRRHSTLGYLSPIMFEQAI